jgi:hypothetical protein
MIRINRILSALFPTMGLVGIALAAYTLILAPEIMQQRPRRDARERRAQVENLQLDSRMPIELARRD